MSQLLDENQHDLRFYYDLKVLRNISLTGYILSIAGGIFCIITFLYILSIYQPLFFSDSEYNEFLYAAEIGEKLELFTSALSILTMIPFFMWLYRAYYNLDFVKLRGLNTTPGWAVGWFFIPLANLYWIVVIFNDLFKGTKHLLGGGSVKTSIHYQKVFPWGLIWIITSVSSSVFDRISVAQFERLDINEAIFTKGIYCTVIANALDIIRVIIAIYLIVVISRRQNTIRLKGITP